MKFHYQNQESYVAVYGDAQTVGFERNSSLGQDMDSDYTTT